MTNQTLDLGGIRVTLLDGGALRLDGGAMFGIIPKPLWTRQVAPDAQNSIPLACNCLLVEWAGESGRRAIVEAGHGPKFGEKERGFFAIDPGHWLLPTLKCRNIDPPTITDVVLTHLHFDHCGGLTYNDGDRPVPTFPNARVHVQRREHDDARANFGIMTFTYREENFTPIDAGNRWRLLDGGEEILPGIRGLPTPGHTRGHQSLQIAGRDRTAIFVGDVMPTRAHVGRPYNMAYDLFPLDNRESKGRILKDAAEREHLLILGHEPATPLLRVGKEKDWFRLEPDAG